MQEENKKENEFYPSGIDVFINPEACESFKKVANKFFNQGENTNTDNVSHFISLPNKGR